MNNRKEFWLSFNNNEDQLRLPIIPPEFEVIVGNNNTKVNIHELGDINLLGKTGLKSININTFFPNQDYSFCQYRGFPNPQSCIDMIEKWRLSGKPIRIIITGTSINLAMGIEKFSYKEQDGTGDVYFDLDLEEYVFTKVKNLSKEGLIEPTKPRGSDDKREVREFAKSYTVKAGDTLSAIAKRMTGNSANYKAIADKNGIKDPNKISIGQVIKL